MRLTWSSNFLKIVILIAVTVGLYAQTINDPFHFDDDATIVNNQAVHYLPDWPRTFQAIAFFQPSRFVTNITFALNYYVHRLDVSGYHGVNILVHFINGCLVWFLGQWLWNFQHDRRLAFSSKKKSSGKKKNNLDGPKENTGSTIAFLSAVLFIVHPVNTQAVTYISQRSESLAALFYLLCVCLYLKGRTSDRNRGGLYLAAIVSGLLATFSKETAVTLPLMIIALEFFLFSKNKNWSIVQFPRWMLATGLIGAFVVLVPAAFHFHYYQKLFTPYLSQSHLGDVLTLPTYLMTQINVFAVFLKLVFIPVGLNLDHDFPMVRSLFEPLAFMNLCILSALLFGAWRWRQKHPMITLAVLWFFLTLSSNIVPRAHVMFEHKLYLALTGLIPGLVVGLASIVKRPRHLVIGLIGLAVIFSVLTLMRNRVWSSEISLWEDVVKKSPQKARVHLSLGTAYAFNDENEKAIESLTRAMGLMSDPYLPHLNRGAVYVKMKNDDLAIKDFDQAIKINPLGVKAYVNRGEVFARRKDYASALADFQKAIAIDNQFAASYKMRGRIYEAMQQFPMALDDYNRALHWEPADPQALAWRGFVLAILGRTDEAIKDFQAAVRLNPRFPDAYTYRGMYYKDQRQMALALKDFNQAVKLNPSYAFGFYQRASFYQTSGEIKKALEDVNQAIILDDQLDLAYALRAILHAQNKEYELALKDFDQALKLNPDFLQVYVNRGSIYLYLNQPQKAVEDLTQAIRLNPGEAQAYSRRAGAYGHLKKYELAVADFTRAIELNPNQGAEYYNRSVIYKEFRQFDLALQDALKAKALGFPVSDQYLNELH